LTRVWSPQFCKGGKIGSPKIGCANQALANAGHFAKTCLIKRAKADTKEPSRTGANRMQPIRTKTLTEQDRTDFERARHALCEQLPRTEAPPAQQVRMRLALWIINTGLETNQADFDLLDRLSQNVSLQKFASSWNSRHKHECGIHGSGSLLSTGLVSVILPCLGTGDDREHTAL
jgi:hypothetical protein